VYGQIGDTQYEVITWRQGGGSWKPHIATLGKFTWKTCCGEFIPPDKVSRSTLEPKCQSCKRIYRDREERAKEAKKMKP
jgi:hypothetical protein